MMTHMFFFIMNPIYIMTGSRPSIGRRHGSSSFAVFGITVCMFPPLDTLQGVPPFHHQAPHDCLSKTRIEFFVQHNTGVILVVVMMSVILSIWTCCSDISTSALPSSVTISS